MKTNKFDIPYHCYELHLEGGRKINVDIGDECDWGNIQPMLASDFDGDAPEGYSDMPGWGNDSDGHIRIVDVRDMETGEFVDVRLWAEEVWSLASKYSS